MAYQILYYADPAMTSRMMDADSLPDAALGTYPAPEYPHTAVATHSTDPSLTRYGYAGAWHRIPPRQARAADYKRYIQARNAARHARARLGHMGLTIRRCEFGVRVTDADRTSRLCSWADLAVACAQDDADAAAVYLAIRTVANEQQ